MPKSVLKKKDEPQQCVIWIRKQLDMTQSQFGRLIGASRDTIQSIELGRLPLSERFAYAISEQTGVRPKWLLANKLKKPLPDPKLIREEFDRAQTGTWKGIYKAHLLPLAVFFRAYVVYRAVVNEIGFSGLKDAGGFKLLWNLCFDLIELIPDKRRHKIVYLEAREIMQNSPETYRRAMEDLRELQRNLREQVTRSGQ